LLQNTRGGGIDLPQDLRDELADFAGRLRGRSHYEILGVGPDSDAPAIRRPT
jgi:hypothetical protein